MSPAQWQRVCQLVDALASAPPEAQQKLLHDSAEETEVRLEAGKLLDRLSSTGHFLSKPLAGLPETRQFPDGTRVADRFVVRRFIGAGGMGEVYEVFDEIAQETRALKTLLGVWAEGGGSGSSEDCKRMADLFRREVQLSCKVAHPNVIRIHDIGEHRGDPPLLFLTMELINGSTLATGVAHKIWDNIAIAGLLRQATAGVAAAHRIGVVHRDLKPANILVRDGDPLSAVVTDFGLARLVETSPVRPGTKTSFTVLSVGPQHEHQADGAGTPAYMAPECFEGSPATAASDVYALGLIFFEAFTGQLPFANLPLVGALVLRGRSRPQLDSATARMIGPRWRPVILKCLEPEPSRRFGDAQEVLDALDGKFVWSRRRMLAAAASVAVVSLSEPVYRYVSRRFQWTPVDESLVLTPPAVVSGVAGAAELDLGWLDVLMRKTLEQSEHLRLWDRSGLPEVLERMGKARDYKPGPAEWRDVALRAGSRQVAFWTVAPVSDGYSLSMRLELLNASTPRVAEETPQKTFEAEDRQGLFKAVRDASRWVRQTMGESPAEVAGARLPEDITTSSYEALRAFARGEAYPATRNADALLEYEQAIRYDHDFAMAWMRKGDILSNLARLAEGLSAWKVAIEKSQLRPLSTREDLRLRAMFADDSGDLRSSEQLFLEYTKHFPNEAWGFFFRALPLVLLGHHAEAIACLETAATFPERRVASLLHLGWAWLGLGDDLKARPYGEQLEKMGFPERAARLWASIAFSRGDYDAALNHLNRAGKGQRPEIASETRALQVLVLSEWKGAEEALAHAQENFASDLRQSLRGQGAVNSIFAGYLQMASGEKDAAARSAAQAAAMEPGPWVNRHAGILFARLGRVEQASALIERLEASGGGFARFDAAAQCIRGELAAERGDIRRAQDFFEDSLQKLPQPWPLTSSIRLLQAQTVAHHDLGSLYRDQYPRFALRLRYPDPPRLRQQAKDGRGNPQPI